MFPVNRIEIRKLPLIQNYNHFKESLPKKSVYTNLQKPTIQVTDFLLLNLGQFRLQFIEFNTYHRQNFFISQMVKNASNLFDFSHHTE